MNEPVAVIDDAKILEAERIRGILRKSGFVGEIAGPQECSENTNKIKKDVSIQRIFIAGHKLRRQQEDSFRSLPFVTACSCNKVRFGRVHAVLHYCNSTSRVGEYLRYSSKRYRRYRGSQYLIFILDTFLGSQYLIFIFRYFTGKKIRYFRTCPCLTEEAHFYRIPRGFCSIWY